MASKAGSCVRLIGVDPGLNVTGYGVVERRGDDLQLLEAGVIHSSRGRQAGELCHRLQVLYQELSQILKEFQPQALCLEEIYGHASYPRTSILMGHARGVICLAARLARIPVVNFSAKRIKQAVTGNGNASKLQVQRAVQAYFGLRHLPQPADVADALAAALCYVSAGRARANGLRLSHEGTRWGAGKALLALCPSGQPGPRPHQPGGVLR